MGDHQDRPVLSLLLEALVVSALIGTFLVYGYPGTGPGPQIGVGEIAKLTMPH